MTVSDHYTSVLRSKSCQITSTDQKVLLQAGQAVKTKWNQFWELRNLHNGERTDSIPLPGNRIDNEYALFDDSLIITYRIGERGRENDLRLINRKGEVVKTFHSQQKPIVFYSMTSTGPAFMYRQDSIYRIYHNLNDTVYGITQQQHLIPLYVFHSGEKNIPYEIRSKIWGLGDESTQKQNETYRKLEQKYHCVDNVTETDRYLFAGFTHADRYTYVLYDKQSGNTRLIPACPLPENLWQGNPTLLSNEHVPELHALPNDIDGGLTFWPRSVTEDGDLLAVYDPVDLREKVLATDVSTLRNPAAYQALKEMVTSLPDDNYYIVVQAKVKK